MKLNSIIIDDEALNRNNLRSLLATYCPDIEITGEASSAAEALELVVQNNPDLLFLDIELNGPSGFDLLRSINGNHDFEVIFVTAFGHYGIQAAKACAIDYLLKPIDIFELLAAVAKAKEQVSFKRENRRLKELVANLDRQDEEKRIALPLSDKIEFVPLNRIIRLEADGNYTRFFLEGNKKYLVCKTLKEYSDLLITQNFIRTHQSHLINCSKISAYVKNEGGYILMEDGSQVPISRQKKEEVIARIMK